MNPVIDDGITKENLLELLGELIGVHSPYFEEKEVMAFTHAWLSERGFRPELHRYHETEKTDFNGVNVVGSVKGANPGPRILLNAHLDTVNVCKGWGTDPLAPTLVGDRLYGLGALDMKSGAAAILLAMDAFKHRHPDFSGELVYAFVSDEEGPYGLGTQAAIRDGLFDGVDLAVIPEPSSGFCGIPFPCLCLGARGGYNYTVSFAGKSAHAANPEEGVSAIVDAAKVMIALKESVGIADDRLGAGSLCVIETKGGGQACSVADEASFTVFRHVVRGEDEAYLRAEVEDAARRAGIRSEMTVSFREGVFGGSGGFDPYIADESHPYTAALRESIVDATGKPATIAYFSSIGDFNTVATRLGVPTFVFGPDGENYHTRDEFVYVDSAVGTARVIYRFLERLLCPL
jgi:succinyl-diaminopimelate desuccinylase